MSDEEQHFDSLNMIYIVIFKGAAKEGQIERTRE
jgi:hypothetical protein